MKAWSVLRGARAGLESKWVGRLVRVDCNELAFPLIKDDFRGSLDVRLLFSERVGFADDTRAGRADIVPNEPLESPTELLGFDEEVEDKREDLRVTVDLS